MDSTQRKTSELKRLNTYDDKHLIVKSPYFNDSNTNPCIKEQNLSTKCVIENYANRELCKDATDNYIVCQKFWREIRLMRFFQGIKPYLPPPEERSDIIAKEKDRIRDLIATYKNVV